jgi:hypothetical protein
VDFARQNVNSEGSEKQIHGGIMKQIGLLLSLAVLASTGHAATQSLSDILNQAKCVPQRSARTGELIKYKCGSAKTDSLQMMGVQKAAVTFTSQDEFESFEREATDLSHVSDSPEAEIEVE